MNLDRRSDAPVAKRRRLGDGHVGPPLEGERVAGHDSLLVPQTSDSSSSNYTQDWQRNTLPSFSNHQWPSHPAATVGGMAVTDHNCRYRSSGGTNNLAPPHHDLPQYGTNWQRRYNTTSMQFGQCQIASPFNMAPGFNHIGMADQQRNMAWLRSMWDQMGVSQPPQVMYNNSVMMPGIIEPSIDPRELDLPHTVRASDHEIPGPSGASVTFPPQPVQTMSTDSPLQERPEVETVCFGMV